MRIKQLLFIFFGVILLITGCSGGESLSADDVISEFKNANLEVENPKEITQDDDIKMFPAVPAEATRFWLPSIQETSTGHVFIFKNHEDLDKVKTFYDELGKQSEMLRSWTYSKENILLHLNGNMSEEQFNKYKEVMDSL